MTALNIERKLDQIPFGFYSHKTQMRKSHRKKNTARTHSRCKSLSGLVDTVIQCAVFSNCHFSIHVSFFSSVTIDTSVAIPQCRYSSISNDHIYFSFFFVLLFLIDISIKCYNLILKRIQVTLDLISAALYLSEYVCEDSNRDCRYERDPFKSNEVWHKWKTFRQR